MHSHAIKKFKCQTNPMLQFTSLLSNSPVVIRETGETRFW